MKKLVALLLMLIFLLVTVFAVGMVRSVFLNDDIAVRALDTQGYSNIKITDYIWFAVGLRGCGITDTVRFTAIANNPAGKNVQVYVCTGWLFKGATIRTL